MKCKNCGHELNKSREYPKNDEKGIAYFYYHNDSLKKIRGMGYIHADYCNCINPELEVKQ